MRVGILIRRGTSLLIKIMLGLIFIHIAVLIVGRNASVMLPNGLIGVRRYFPYVIDRTDLLSPDRKRTIVRDVEFICFNDRIVEASSYERGQGGTYDIETEQFLRGDAKTNIREYRVLRHSPGGDCNGYLKGRVGIGLLFNRAPFRPACDWFNFENPTLKNKSWLKRPCDKDPYRGWADLPASAKR